MVRSLRWIRMVSLIILMMLFLMNCTIRSKSTSLYCKPPWDRYFTCFGDHVTFNYDSEIIYTMDEEIIYPRKFSINLPKDFKTFKFIGSEDFIFYYKNQQAIYIKINLRLSNVINDTIYTPSLNQIDSIIDLADTEIGIIKNSAVKFSRNRKHQVISRKGGVVLLYNIRQTNYNNFFNNIRSFEVYD